MKTEIEMREVERDPTIKLNLEKIVKNMMKFGFNLHLKEEFLNPGGRSNG